MSYPRRLERRWWGAVITVAAGAVLLTACGSSSASSTIRPASGQALGGFAGTAGSPSALPTTMPSGTSGMPMPSSAPTGGTGGATSPVASDSVTVRNFAFGPLTVTVKVGATVHWTNQDAEAHTVTSDAGVFGSPVLQPGASYSYTFTKPGIYTYHCTIHPFMTGKVVVS